ncbi:D-alanyl-D-alanine carboxypeptidase [Streptomyces sp. NPDC006923]|uniref:D-alanyl-D-alanine carboxypeptidase n=1 Tax=Streptomyces sp. NPDC006923 TaxID=3155355 RepID=UPI0033DE17E9
MRHEGDAVAGESPGRSEQRKSSGEATPGERDPRLAVFREPAAVAQGPTRVATANGADDSGETEGSGGQEAGRITARPEPSKTGAGSGDTKDADTKDTNSTNSTDTKDTKSADTEDAETKSAETKSADRTGTPTEEGASPKRPESKPESKSEPKPAEPEATTGPDAKPGRKPDSTPSDDGTDRTSSPESAAKPKPESPSKRSEPSEPSGPVSDAPSASASKPKSEPKSKSAPEPTPKPAPEPKSAPDSDSAEPAATAPASGARPDGPEDRTGGKKPSWAKPAGAAAGAPDAKSADGSTAQPAAKSTGQDGAPEASKPATKAATKPSAGGPDGAESDGRGEPQVDQPTTVLKALKQPPVDQPTTALKVPRLPEEKKAEPSAARDSTFVPLRRDDRVTGTPPGASSSVAAPAAPASSLTEAERTRQQPLPPKPPLDLLAELTNTPPPPETPVRTTVRRVKIWTPLVLLLLLVVAVVQALRPLPAPTLALSATPTYTFEGGRLDMPWPTEGQGAVEVEGVGTIGTYGEQKPAPIASVAKTMTAYVILKNHPITGKQVGPKITVDKKAGEEAKLVDESRVPIEEGQQFTERQMLQLLMIPSGNNVARLLARWDAPSQEEFVEKMNAAAKDLGMTKTTYTDPSGLEASTVSTATDQLKLGKAVMQNDIFREIVNTPQIRVPGLDLMIYNNNRILLEPGVSGIKTGSSTPAGGNLLWTADTIVDGTSRRIIGMVMSAQKAAILDDKLNLAIDNSLKLIRTAQKGVTSATIVKKGDVVGFVDDGLGGRTPVVTTKDLKAVGWAGLQVRLRLGEDADQGIPHSAQSGTVVGELTIGTGTGAVSAPVALQKDLAEPGLGAKLTRVG